MLFKLPTIAAIVVSFDTTRAGTVGENGTCAIANNCFDNLVCATYNNVSTCQKGIELEEHCLKDDNNKTSVRRYW